MERKGSSCEILPPFIGGNGDKHIVNISFDYDTDNIAIGHKTQEGNYTSVNMPFGCLDWLALRLEQSRLSIKRKRR